MKTGSEDQVYFSSGACLFPAHPSDVSSSSAGHGKLPPGVCAQNAATKLQTQRHTIFILYIIYTKENSSFKLSWIIFVVVLPVTAIFIYFITSKRHFSKRDLKKQASLIDEMNELLIQDEQIKDNVVSSVASHINTINNLSPFIAYNNTTVEYLEIGEKMHAVMLEELKLAEKFIYMEYFIISNSSMLDEIFEVLCDKASEGVEVKIMYDAAGSGTTVPKNFIEKCASFDIECRCFNPFKNSIYKYVNYRDHRKMTIVDGNVCISGGINIADEYVNRVERFGHWKDTAVILKGEAVFSFTTMFVKMWEFLSNESISLDDKRPSVEINNNVVVMPYGDGTDNENDPAINLYLKVVNSASKYLYIMTPYVILDDDMTSALILSAKTGVDVRIITPGIADKKFVNSVTKANYDILIKYGVKIYEYSPGFIHAKTVVFDDIGYIVGSINFDFRSLIWNYECATYVHNSDSLLDVKQDFLKVQEQSIQINMDDKKLVHKLWHSVLKVISPQL